MRQRLIHSIVLSLEWRFYAYIITNLFLWFTSGELWTATMMALQLQIILLAAHCVWYYFRGERYHPREAAP